MASATKVHVSVKHRPTFSVNQLKLDSAARTSTLLQENHEKFDMFFNDSGFHNHLVHHMLTLYALGAQPSVLQHQYDDNTSYQRPQKPLQKKIVDDMQDYACFKKYLGQRDRYHDFMVFFRNEIDEKGWQEVLNEWLFARDEKADDMLARLFAGLIHPLIHVGFGVEFEQPAIIAEGLAEAAVHGTYLQDFFVQAESGAASRSRSTSPPLMELLRQTRDSETIRSAAARGGTISGRAKKELADISARFTVDPSNIDSKLREVFGLCAFFTLAAQRPPKQVKIDFYQMHSINACVFLPAFVGPSVAWLSAENKCRLLEWKARSALDMYAKHGCADLLLEEITNYQPLRKVDALSTDEQWSMLFDAVCKQSDDGHAVKLVRALATGNALWKDAGETTSSVPGYTMTQDMWLKMAHMAVDSSGEGSEGPRWIRDVGHASAWSGVRNRVERAVATL